MTHRPMDVDGIKPRVTSDRVVLAIKSDCSASLSSQQRRRQPPPHQLILAYHSAGRQDVGEKVE